MTRAPEPDAESLVERASVIHPGLAPDVVYLDYNATTPVEARMPTPRHRDTRSTPRAHWSPSS